MPAALQQPWEVFRAQAERVEAARHALLGCLPIGRVDPAPVPVGLDTLEAELAGVAGELDAWRVDQVEQAWQRCRAAVEEAAAAVPVARRVVARTGELEELLDAVTTVVEPLDAWHEAEAAWLRLRRRARRR